MRAGDATTKINLSGTLTCSRLPFRVHDVTGRYLSPMIGAAYLFIEQLLYLCGPHHKKKQALHGDIGFNRLVTAVCTNKAKTRQRAIGEALTISLFLSSSITGTIRADTIPLLTFRMLIGSSSSGKSLTSVCPSTMIFKGYLFGWTNHHFP